MIYRTAMQSIHHLTSLQAMVNTKLEAQNEVIESIHHYAEKAADDINQGVLLLGKTEETMGGPKWWVLWMFLFASGILIALDTWFS